MRAWRLLSRSLRDEVVAAPFPLRPCYRLSSTSLRPRPSERASDVPPGELEVIDWKTDELTPEVDADQLATYPYLNKRALARYRDPPRRFRALVRDFIDDSLYNPHYGYFSTQAEILETGVDETVGLPFGEIRNEVAFDNEIAKRYGALSTDVAIPGRGEGAARQVWHTPTELFKPWYARAVARYLVDEHRRAGDEGSLLVYELGAGNGTLMRGILDYIAEAEPEIYARTRYNIIEISPRLAGIQRERAERGRHAHKLAIHNASIFDWTRTVPEACFFLAFEVLDNFAHDVVRYTVDQHVPLQCFVAGDHRGDLVDYYEPVSDPLTLRYLSLFQQTPSCQRAPHISHLLQRSPTLRRWRSSIPLTGNLGPPIFIPTKVLLLLDILRDHFPGHRLLMSDFDRLPDAVAGQNGPVVQTRYKGQTIPCTTYLVTPGFFDIFFPTDFDLFRELYALVLDPPASASASPEAPPRLAGPGASAPTSTRQLDIATHRDFLMRWAEPGCTRLRDGSDPMLEYYANAKFAYATRGAS